MAWIFLLVAGLLETAWAAGLKALGDRFSVALLVATAVLMAVSLGALYWSMRTLPLGVAYPIWTGIGSVGSVIVSVLLFKAHIGPVGVVGVACIVLGIALLGLETQ